MIRIAVLAVALALAAGSSACAGIEVVKAGALQPRYLRPTPALRSALPLVVVYDPDELPDVVSLSVPSGFPAATMVSARSLVTVHLRSGLESLFEHVSVTGDGRHLPPGAVVCTVHFVDVGLAVAPGGKTMVGTLEWSIALSRPGQPQVLYSWGERTVGSREGAGAWGGFDPGPVVQGAIEASLRAMLKDMNDKGVIEHVTAASSKPS